MLKMYFQKNRNSEGEGGSRLWNSEGMGGGVTHFGISEGKGGIKHGSRPWLGMDIFWNCPIHLQVLCHHFINNYWMRLL